MKTFHDNKARKWAITLNIDALKRVRSLLDVDLMDAVNGKLLERLIIDPVLLCDVIYCVVKPDADAKEITDEDFGRAMAGDAIERATNALLEELVDFFPERKRLVLTKALAKLDKFENLAIEAADRRLESGELDRQMEAALKTFENPSMPGGSSGSLRVLPESIPDA